jgi:glucan 1,3-beta-glucosidase
MFSHYPYSFNLVMALFLHERSLMCVTCSYLQAHNMIRGITGYGQGNGPYMAIHDGFNLGLWAGFLPGSDRIILDTHPYLAFNGQANTAPVVTDDGLGEPGGTWPLQACAWGSSVNDRSDLLIHRRRTRH